MLFSGVVSGSSSSSGSNSCISKSTELTGSDKISASPDPMPSGTQLLTNSATGTMIARSLCYSVAMLAVVAAAVVVIAVSIGIASEHGADSP